MTVILFVAILCVCRIELFHEGAKRPGFLLFDKGAFRQRARRPGGLMSGRFIPLTSSSLEQGAGKAGRSFYEAATLRYVGVLRAGRVACELLA